MDALLWELLSDGNADDTVEVLIRLNEQSVLPAVPVEMVAQIGNIMSCRIRRGDIAHIRRDAAVASMKAPRKIATEPLPEALPLSLSGAMAEAVEAVLPARRPATPLTGQGVWIGIADWGLDFTHPNFLHPDGRTRFEALWDQSAAYDGNNPYGYGRIYAADQLNEALESDRPFATLGYHPGAADLFQQGMHGTHVLDIAAGNSSAGQQGMAPEARLLGVHLGTRSMGDLEALGDSVRVFDALHFLDHAAGSSPLVINMSVGSHGDSHTGLSLIELAIDTLVTRRSGRAIVQSCGNYQTTSAHAAGTVGPSAPFTLYWVVPARDRSQNELEIWYDGADEFAVSLVSPQGETLLEAAGIGPHMLAIGGNPVGRYYHRLKEPNTGLNHINLYLKPTAGEGEWQVMLHGKTLNGGGQFDAWIERDSACGSCQSYFRPDQASPLTNTGSICNGKFSIAVAACDPHDGSIGDFSSAGPTRDGRTKPDLTAPGVGVQAARSAGPQQQRATGQLCIKSGTSMAAPYVAGAIALFYEQHAHALPDIHALRAALFAACETGPDRPAHRFGHGILHVSRLLSLQPATTSSAMNFLPEELAPETAADIRFQGLARRRQRAAALPQPATCQHQAPCNCQQQEVPATVDETGEAFYAEEAWEQEAETPTLMEWVGQHLPQEAGFAEMLGYWGEAGVPAHLRDRDLAAALFDALHPKRPDTDRAYFERFFRPASLPGRRAEIQPGALVVRRQYGHTTQAVWGFVERLEGPFAHLRTPAGVQRARVLDGTGNLHWEAMVVDGAGANGQEESYAEEVKGFSIDANGEIIPPDSMSIPTRNIYNAMIKTNIGKIAFRNLIESGIEITFALTKINGNDAGYTQWVKTKNGNYTKAIINIDIKKMNTGRFKNLDFNDEEFVNVVGVHESVHAVISEQRKIEIEQDNINSQTKNNKIKETKINWKIEEMPTRAELCALLEYRSTIRPDHLIQKDKILSYYESMAHCEHVHDIHKIYEPYDIPDLWKQKHQPDNNHKPDNNLKDSFSEESFAEDTTLCNGPIEVPFSGGKLVITKIVSISNTLNIVFTLNGEYGRLEVRRPTAGDTHSAVDDLENIAQEFARKRYAYGNISVGYLTLVRAAFAACVPFQDKFLVNTRAEPEFMAIGYVDKDGKPWVYIGWMGIRRDSSVYDLIGAVRYMNTGVVACYNLPDPTCKDFQRVLRTGVASRKELRDLRPWCRLQPIGNVNNFSGNSLLNSAVNAASYQSTSGPVTGPAAFGQPGPANAAKRLASPYLIGYPYALPVNISIQFGGDAHAMPTPLPANTMNGINQLAAFVAMFQHYTIEITGNTSGWNSPYLPLGLPFTLAAYPTFPPIINNDVQSLSWARAMSLGIFVSTLTGIPPGNMNIQGQGGRKLTDFFWRNMNNLLNGYLVSIGTAAPSAASFNAFLPGFQAANAALPPNSDGSSADPDRDFYTFLFTQFAVGLTVSGSRVQLTCASLTNGSVFVFDPAFVTANPGSATFTNSINNSNILDNDLSNAINNFLMPNIRAPFRTIDIRLRSRR